MQCSEERWNQHLGEIKALREATRRGLEAVKALLLSRASPFERSAPTLIVNLDRGCISYAREDRLGTRRSVGKGELFIDLNNKEEVALLESILLLL